VKVIQQEGYTYRDPITEFLEDLYVNFDFEGAQHKLRECETVRIITIKNLSKTIKCVALTICPLWYQVLINDFFLVSCRDEFIDNARLFIFETYCRIHRCIDIP